ncbi:MAG: glycosyltransferase family 1 protein, partial [Dolichospermum sp.]
KQLYADIITQISRGKHNQVLFLPVFSNVGEPEKLPPDLSERQQRLVIFGTYGRRLPIYQKSMSILRQIVRDLEIKEILDIGKPLGINLKEIDNVPIITLGEQPPENINS